MAIQYPAGQVWSGLIGEKKYAFGPVRLYVVPTDSSEADIDLGPTDMVAWEMDQAWLGLRSSDTGDKDDEKVSTYSDWILKFGLAKPDWYTLSILFPGFEAEFTTSGSLKAIHGVQTRGHSTEDNRFQLTLKQYDPTTNIVTTDDKRIVDFWQVAAIPEKNTVTFDAKGQRFFQITLQAKEDPNHLSPLGRPTAWKLRGA